MAPDTAGSLIAQLLGANIDFAILGRVLGLTEISVAVASMHSRLRRIAFVLGLLLVCAFVAVNLAAIVTDNRIACGCFGASDSSEFGLGLLFLQGCFAAVLVMALRGAALLSEDGEPPFRSNWGLAKYLPILLALGYIGWMVGETTATTAQRVLQDFREPNHDFRGRTLRGLPRLLPAPPPQGYILVFLSPDCIKCRTHLEFWKRMVAGRPSTDPMIVFVSPATNREVLDFMGESVRGRIRMLPEAGSLMRENGIQRVPAYLQISRDYRVIDSSNTINGFVRMINSR